MAQKKQEETFTVTDRRLFTSEGELRKDVPEEAEAPKPAAPSAGARETAPAAQAAGPGPEKGDGNAERDIPLPPTAAEQDAQAAAYRRSSNDLDSQGELSRRSAKKVEMTFERFLAAVFITAMFQPRPIPHTGETPPYSH